jgi:hypothetical protein
MDFLLPTLFVVEVAKCPQVDWRANENNDRDPG